MGAALLLGGEVMSITIAGAPGVIGSIWQLIIKVFSIFAGAA
jgi:hypothetical protein